MNVYSTCAPNHNSTVATAERGGAGAMRISRVRKAHAGCSPFRFRLCRSLRIWIQSVHIAADTRYLSSIQDIHTPLDDALPQPQPKSSQVAHLSCPIPSPRLTVRIPDINAPLYQQNPQSFERCRILQEKAKAKSECSDKAYSAAVVARCGFTFIKCTVGGTLLNHSIGR